MELALHVNKKKLAGKCASLKLKKKKFKGDAMVETICTLILFGREFRAEFENANGMCVSRS